MLLPLLLLETFPCFFFLAAGPRFCFPLVLLLAATGFFLLPACLLSWPVTEQSYLAFRNFNNSKIVLS
jgi:hypothetical protein